MVLDDIFSPALLSDHAAVRIAIRLRPRAPAEKLPVSGLPADAGEVNVLPRIPRWIIDDALFAESFDNVFAANCHEFLDANGSLRPCWSIWQALGVVKDYFHLAATIVKRARRRDVSCLPSRLHWCLKSLRCCDVGEWRKLLLMLRHNSFLPS